ncbi:hypothetical protein DPMN_177103 [Dreissena polymorpha]|uniref:Uncharacterized protein n=1 Tax=Dreissena polymorpha TaxID=45954 RepID=A0A9D4ILA6_DREPO|nr:hypothetical protein DPMN_177103 [Dreissena polymorpha]
MSSRLFTCFHNIHIKKTAPLPGAHVFSTYHDHFQTPKNVTSRVKKTPPAALKNAPPPGGHVFQPTGIIFELVQDINGMNLLTKFHKDRTINVASRVENVPPLGSHVFQANVTIFELIQDIIETNLLTKFHKDWTINVASRVFTKLEINVASRVLTRKTVPPPGGHVFSPIWTIFELVRNINETNDLTKNTAPPPGGHVFQRTETLHEDWASNVTSTVFTSFELNQTINVASRVFTRQMLTAHDGRRTTDDGQKAITLCSGGIHTVAGTLFTDI